MDLKKIIYNIKNNINFKDIIFFFGVSILFFGILINFEYATDTYAVFSTGAKQNATHFMGSGRFITAFATIIVKIMQLSEMQIYVASFVSAIIFLVISLYEMNKLIKKDIKSNTISKLIAILIILNVFIIELFLFVEKGILILSILMNVYAIKYMIQFLKNRSKKDIFKVLIFMFLANGSYQGTVGLFIAVILVYIIRYSENIKQFIINNLITVTCYAIPAILDLIIAKMFAGDRVSGKIVLEESLSKIIAGTKSMIGTYNIIPKYIFPIVILLLVITILCKIIKDKKDIKEKVLQVLELGYIIVGNLVVTILPQLMQNTDSIWMVARSTYTFASLIGILMLYLFISFENINKAKTIFNLENMTILLSIVFLSLQYCNFTKIEISRYKLNAEDKQVTLQIIENITKYENETGNIITSIALYQDKNISYTYADVFATGDMNVKAYSAEWAARAIIKHYSNREFNFIEKDENIANYFKERDWNFFNEEQLIFDNNTLYICCY